MVGDVTKTQDPIKKKSEAKGLLLGGGASNTAAASAPQALPVANPTTVPSMYVAPRPRPDDAALRWSVASGNVQAEPTPQGTQGSVERTEPIDDHPIARLEDKGKAILEERIEDPDAVMKVVNWICDDVAQNELLTKALYLGSAWAGVPYPWITSIGNFSYATTIDAIGPTATAFNSANFGISFSGRRYKMHVGQESQIQAKHRQFEGIANQDFRADLSQAEFEYLAHLQTDQSAQPNPGDTRYWTRVSIDSIVDSQWGFNFSTAYGPGFSLPEEPFANGLITQQQVMLPSGETLSQTSTSPYWTNWVRGGVHRGNDLFGSQVGVGLGYNSVQGLEMDKLINLSSTYGAR